MEPCRYFAKHLLQQHQRCISMIAIFPKAFFLLFLYDTRDWTLRFHTKLQTSPWFIYLFFIPIYIYISVCMLICAYLLIIYLLRQCLTKSSPGWLWLCHPLALTFQNSGIIGMCHLPGSLFPAQLLLSFMKEALHFLFL